MYQEKDKTYISKKHATAYSFLENLRLHMRIRDSVAILIIKGAPTSN